jgi:glycosyltransferase involved in cell wall biosynthesis
MSICIATHERAELLRGTLESIAQQSVPPADVVVSDSSSTGATRDAVSHFAARHPDLPVRFRPSVRKALPWQRWAAFTQSSGEWVLFLDDDVRLAPDALAELDRHCQSIARAAPVAGIGLVFTWEGSGAQPVRDSGSFKERWLATDRFPPGSITPGGQTVSFFGLPPGKTVPVEALWGGAMAFRRDVVNQIGCLDNLVELYEGGIGRGEDGVLSRCASRYGELLLINLPLAFHPRVRQGPAPYARSGWRLGLTATWGRAHTMRWLASDRRACRREWMRLAGLELLRGTAAVARRPWSPSAWAQVSGTLAGTLRAAARWEEIPERPRSERSFAGAA